MATDEKEEKQSCENCDAKWTIIFDLSQCDSIPEVCPFCGAAAGLDSVDDVCDDERDDYDEEDDVD